MKAATSTMVAPPAAQALDWNWRADLADLEVSIAHAEAGDPWNWRRDLADLEAELDRLAERLGL